MSDVSVTPTTVFRRQTRPERINIGDDELVRNDIIAKEYGATERTINRGDVKGAPFTYVGGVKYRPLKRYREFITSQIQTRGQPPARRQRSSHHHR
jgi:hypothetical protein